MTLDELKAEVRKAGYTVSDGASWEDENVAYAFSVESHGPATYGHPKYTACFHKKTGWLTLGNAARKVA